MTDLIGSLQLFVPLLSSCMEINEFQQKLLLLLMIM